MPWRRTSTGPSSVCRSSSDGGNNANGSLATFGSNSNYNAMQVAFKKRMTNGVQFKVNYTWSKALGTFSQEYNNSSVPTPFGNPVSSVNVTAVNYGPL